MAGVESLCERHAEHRCAALANTFAHSREPYDQGPFLWQCYIRTRGQRTSNRYCSPIGTCKSLPRHEYLHLEEVKIYEDFSLIQNI